MTKVGAFIAKEVREVLPPTIVFLVLFHMLALTKAVSLGDFSSAALRAATATVLALIVGKAILVVEALPISRLFAAHIPFQLLWKTLLFFVMALLLRLVEEVVPLAVKHGGVAAGIKSMHREVSWPLFWVLTLWVLGALLCYSLVAHLVRAVGTETVKHVFLGKGTKRAER